MHSRALRSFGVAAMLALVLVMMAYVTQTGSVALQAAQGQETAPQTLWGEPDLQGIWSVELLVPLCPSSDDLRQGGA